MSERLNLIVEDGIPDMLTDLAGGVRRRGQWISDLVKSMHDQRQPIVASDLEQVKMGFAGLVGTVKMLEGRVIQLERQASITTGKVSA